MTAADAWIALVSLTILTLVGLLGWATRGEGL